MTDPLWQDFLEPPDEARPRAWWHWMDGNVDPAGVRRDLRWLHAVGVRGVQLFDGAMGGPLIVPAAVRPGSTTWRRAIASAVETADELGIELAVATSSGWSASGGPWVAPADAMKKLVWSETPLEGGGRRIVGLAALPDAPGLFQDCRRWGLAADAPRWATDSIVLAVPADPVHVAHRPAEVVASAILPGAAPERVEDWGCLVDGSFDGSVLLPRDPEATSSAWVEQIFDEPVTVRSAVVGLPGPRGFGAAPPPSAVLEASDDGVTYREVAALPVTTVPARTVSFAATTARRFRLVLTGASAAEVLPALDEGMQVPPVLRRMSEFVVSEFALRAAGRVHHAEVKAGFGVVPDYYAVGTDARIRAGSVDPDAIVDVTSSVTDGVLRWDAPPGLWTILRLGASLTGQTNGPASPETTGLEVDKLDGPRVSAYLDEHLARFGADEGFAALLSDSIEAGPQNWTDALFARFADARGYDPLPWLPALAGFIVRTASDSDRFLYDYRRTISELLASEYYGTLAAAAHARGMVYYAEALEDQRPQLGDDLAMRAHADVPMGAMWTFLPEHGPRPTYVADLKGAASVAHVHGKAWTGAEAFTSFDRPWSSTPRSLKHVADLQLALGVTRFCIHTSPHQPLAAPPPGIALAPFLGQAFTVNETWAGDAGPWIDYLGRCSAVLSSGEPAVDIAYFVGEEAPVTALFGGRFDDAVPVKVDFDYVGTDGLALLSMENDRLASAGARYRLLYLGGSSDHMTIATLRHVERLLDAGATVVGVRPDRSPSLADDEVEFARLCDRVWTLPRARGRVLPTRDLGTALTELGVHPAIGLEDAEVRRIARIVGGRRIMFVANPDDRERTFVATSQVGLSAWDPVTVQTGHLEPLVPSGGGERRYAVRLPAFGSLFLVEDHGAGPRRVDLVDVPVRGDWTLELPDTAPLTLGPEPRLWTDADSVAAGFSGTATYRVTTKLHLPADATRVLLDLGDTFDLARVRVNGVDCGVAWTPPFRVDVSGAIRTGTNEIEVHVTNPWRNRLIAESAAPSGEISTPMTRVFEPTARHSPAGLAGPVRIVAERPQHPSSS